MNKKLISIVVVVVIVSGGLGFWGGMKYQSSQTPAFGSGNFARGVNGKTGNQAGMARGGGTIGEVLSKDATSITVKLPTGGSKIVFFDSSTSVMKTASSSLDAVVVGSQVVVGGSTNSDGSVSAKTIQIR